MLKRHLVQHRRPNLCWCAGRREWCRRCIARPGCQIRSL